MVFPVGRVLQVIGNGSGGHGRFQASLASTIVLELAKRSFLVLDSANKQEIMAILELQKLSSVILFNDCCCVRYGFLCSFGTLWWCGASLVVELFRLLFLWVVIVSHEIALIPWVVIVSHEVVDTVVPQALLLPPRMHQPTCQG